MDPTDEQLINQGRFGDLLKRYRKPCYGRACHILRDPDLAEDAVQEAFVRAYRVLVEGRFRSESRVETWLYSIVQNTARTLYKKERKRKEHEVKPGDLSVTDSEGGEDLLKQLIGIDPATSPADQVVSGELIEKVREAVASLPENWRDAVILIHFEGCSYREAAKVLKVTVSTVKYRVEQGEERLRNLLRPYVEEALPASPRRPEFQGEHITLQEYEALPDEEKARYLESARERNVEWLERIFQTRRAAWLMVIDGQVRRSGHSLQDYPSPEEFFAICRQEGKYPFVFLHPAATAVEEASTPWHTTSLPGDRYPALTVHLVAGQAVASVDADLDTGAWEVYMDMDWLQANRVAQVPAGLPRWQGLHLGRTFTYTLLPISIEVVDEGGVRRWEQRPILGVWNWAQSPFVQINPARRALIGRGPFLRWGCILSLDFRKRITEVYFGHRIVAHIRRVIRGGKTNP